MRRKRVSITLLSLLRPESTTRTSVRLFPWTESIPKKSLELACLSSSLALTQGSQAEWRHSMSLGVPSASASGVWHSTQRVPDKGARAAPGEASESAEPLPASAASPGEPASAPAPPGPEAPPLSPPSGVLLIWTNIQHVRCGMSRMMSGMPATLAGIIILLNWRLIIIYNFCIKNISE